MQNILKATQVALNSGQDLEAAVTARPTSAALAAAGGAALIGSNDGWSNVQLSLNARIQRVSLYADLQAISPANALLSSTASVTGRLSVSDGGLGIFDWFTGDQSANVANDPQKGVWVPPTSDTTGASGAWKRRISGDLRAEWFGFSTALGDNAIPFGAAVNYAILTGKRLQLPEGDFSYSALPNIKQDYFSMLGAGSVKTILRYTGAGNALSFDAFSAGGGADPFIYNNKIGGFQIIGATMTKGLYAQGIAQSEWFDIKINGTAGTVGTIGFNFAGCMLSEMNNLTCSYHFGTLPYTGLLVTAGTRAGVSVGASTNNVWRRTYMEQCSIGIQLAANGADQNVFLGGSPEACLVYGLVVGTTCRFNTFIGLGFENSTASTADVADSGISSRYINCYSSKYFAIAAVSRGCEVSGGYFEKLEVVAGALDATVKDVTVNNWNTGSGGFFNGASGTRYRNVYDITNAVYVYKTVARSNIVVGASPFVYTNTLGVPNKVRVFGGTVTAILITRGADSWNEGNPVAAGGGAGTAGMYMLMPGDQITVSYTVAPSMNAIPMAGF